MLIAPVNFFLYDELKGKTMSEIMSKGKAIILMQIHNAEGETMPGVGHWIALLTGVDDRGDFIEHFDSYGIGMDKELALTHSEPLLKDLTKGHRVKQDKEKLQMVREEVNTCGRHCVSRCNLPLTYEEYVQFLRTVQCPPDTAVTLMTINPLQLRKG